MRSVHRPGYGRSRSRRPAWLAVLVITCTAAAALGAAPEFTLARLRPGRDKLVRAVQLYGKRFTEAFPNSPEHLLWADPAKRLYLRIELRDDKTIESVTVASFGPHGAPASSLPAGVAATGRGLRLGDSMQKAIQVYGKPYFQGPSSEGDRELTFMVHKFSAEVEQPQVLETSYDPRSRRLVKITLAFAYY